MKPTMERKAPSGIRCNAYAHYNHPALAVDYPFHSSLGSLCSTLLKHRPLPSFLTPVVSPLSAIGLSPPPSPLAGPFLLTPALLQAVTSFRFNIVFST